MISRKLARVVKEDFFFGRDTKHSAELLSIPLHRSLPKAPFYGLKPSLPHGCLQEPLIASSKRESFKHAQFLVCVDREFATKILPESSGVARRTRANHNHIHAFHAKGGLFFSEASNLLTAKDSAKMTYEHEQCVHTAQQVAETYPLPVLVLQFKVSDLFEHGSSSRHREHLRVKRPEGLVHQGLSSSPVGPDRLVMIST